MSRCWLWSPLGVALAAGCLLPDVSVDPELDEPDMTTAGNQPGGSSGGGGTMNVLSNAGAGGAAGSNVMAAGAGGSGAVSPPTGGAGGGTGGTNTGAAGAGGSAMRTAAASCSITNNNKEEACAAYCVNYEQSCGDFPLAYTYGADRDCGTICYNSAWPVGNAAEKGSVLCRCYHATLALNNGLTPHCYHAAEVPSMENGCELPPP